MSSAKWRSFCHCGGSKFRSTNVDTMQSHKKTTISLQVRTCVRYMPLSTPFGQHFINTWQLYKNNHESANKYSLKVAFMWHLFLRWIGIRFIYALYVFGCFLHSLSLCLGLPGLQEAAKYKPGDTMKLVDFESVDNALDDVLKAGVVGKGGKWVKRQCITLA